MHGEEMEDGQFLEQLLRACPEGCIHPRDDPAGRVGLVQKPWKVLMEVGRDQDHKGSSRHRCSDKPVKLLPESSPGHPEKGRREVRELLGLPKAEPFFRKIGQPRRREVGKA